jgi:arylsulfatase A
MKLLRIFAAGLTLFAAGLLHAAEKPNIIVILADDLGYGDVSCYGATELDTPNIDRLAEEGLRFTSGYCSASTCTPTRYSLLTGQYAFRKRGSGISGINGTALIPAGTPTLASMLKKAGYATAVVGKWHLGLGSGDAPDWNGEIKPGPLEIGFDYSFLLPNTNDRVPSVYVVNHRVKDFNPLDPIIVSGNNPNDQPTGKTHRHRLKMDWSHGHNSTIHNGIGRIGFMAGGYSARWLDEELADEWVLRSVEWIEDHRDDPFFLFFSSHDIHVPRMPHPRFQGKSGLGFRGDAILQLDWCVGRLLGTLDRLDLTEETLIVFCSDNGPVLDDGYQDGAVEKLGDHKPAGPYRGGKYSIFEGGTRTPFITYWPGTIEPGLSDKIVSTVDLPASMAALAGEELPEDAAPDSFNVLPALLGKAEAEGRDHVVQQNNRGTHLAVRIGQWKLLDFGTKQASSALTYKKEAGHRYALYNLAEDPSEQNNLAEEEPERLERMKSHLEEIREANRTRP